MRGVTAHFETSLVTAYKYIIVKALAEEDIAGVLAKILQVRKDDSAVDFCVHSPPGGCSVNITNNGVVSRYPSWSLVYNAIDSGLAAAECTLWEWAWLAKKTVDR